MGVEGSTRINWTKEDKALALVVVEKNDMNWYKSAKEFTDLMRGKYPQLAQKDVQRSTLHRFHEVQTNNPDPEVTEYMRAQIENSHKPQIRRLVDKLYKVVEYRIDAMLIDPTKINTNDMYRANHMLMELSKMLNLLDGKAQQITEQRVVHDPTLIRAEIAEAFGDIANVVAEGVELAARARQIEDEIIDATSEELPELVEGLVSE
jgi:hypothetical protein